MKSMNHVIDMAKELYHEFGVTKSALVAGSTVAGACIGFVTSVAVIPNHSIVEIVETIEKEN